MKIEIGECDEDGKAPEEDGWESGSFKFGPIVVFIVVVGLLLCLGPLLLASMAK